RVPRVARPPHAGAAFGAASAERSPRGRMVDATAGSGARHLSRSNERAWACALEARLSWREWALRRRAAARAEARRGRDAERAGAVRHGSELRRIREPGDSAGPAALSLRNALDARPPADPAARWPG